MIVCCFSHQKSSVCSSISCQWNFKHTYFVSAQINSTCWSPPNLQQRSNSLQLKYEKRGRPVSQLVEQAPHTQRLCPRAADSGSIPPVVLCRMSPPCPLFSCPVYKGTKAPKNIFKNKKTKKTIQIRQRPVYRGIKTEVGVRTSKSFTNQ